MSTQLLPDVLPPNHTFKAASSQQGHLTRFLSFGLGLSVTAVEADPALVATATKFDAQLTRALEKEQQKTVSLFCSLSASSCRLGLRLDSRCGSATSEARVSFPSAPPRRFRHRRRLRATWLLGSTPERRGRPSLRSWVPLRCSRSPRLHPGPARRSLAGQLVRWRPTRLLDDAPLVSRTSVRREAALQDVRTSS